jgi:hypothetical protein
LDQSVQNLWVTYHEATFAAEISNKASYRASLPSVAVAHATQSVGSGTQVVVYQSGCSGPLLKLALHMVIDDIGGVESSGASARTDAGAKVTCFPIKMEEFTEQLGTRSVKKAAELFAEKLGTGLCKDRGEVATIVKYNRACLGPCSALKSRAAKQQVSLVSDLEGHLRSNAEILGNTARELKLSLRSFKYLVAW